ncbi:MAG: hypothetical protein H9535_08315 [Ignavibacteria bacterium]|nr:hypothetical protein [Ignavibacteria bacterium]
MIQQTKKLRLDELHVDSFVTSTKDFVRTLHGGEEDTNLRCMAGDGNITVKDASCEGCSKICLQTKDYYTGSGNGGTFMATNCQSCNNNCGGYVPVSQQVNVGCSGPDQFICG